MTDGGRRPGRRRGASSAREDILAAARTLFARSGIDGTPVRAIAAEAGVDSALVHHYFGTKRDLFLAAVAIPVDPSIVTDRIAATPDDELGHTIVDTVLHVWHGDFQEAGVALVRSVVAGPDPGLMRTFVTDVVMRDVAERVDEPPGSAPIRIALAASQIAGLVLTRYVVGFDAVRAIPREDLVRLVGPTVQLYLTEPL